MIKIAYSATALCLTSTFAFADGYVAPSIGVEPVTVTEGAAAFNSGLLVPAGLLLTVVAAVASDSDYQKPDDVGKMQKNRPMNKETEAAGVSSSTPDNSGAEPAEKAEVGVTPPVVTEGGTEASTTSQSGGVSSSIPDSSGTESAQTTEVGVIPPIVTEGGTETSTTSSSGSILPSIPDNSGAGETVMDKMIKIITENGAVTMMPEATTSTTSVTQ